MRKQTVHEFAASALGGRHVKVVIDRLDKRWVYARVEIQPHPIETPAGL